MAPIADTAPMTSHINTITIRRGFGDDEADLLGLAALDSARPLEGDALVAEIAGEPWAAIELASGRVIADPFRASADIVDLLRLRLARMSGKERARRRRFARLRLRSAAELA
jgi:hypothetical protein